MSIINLTRKDSQPFTQIPNSTIRDPRITPNAFRLLAFLMSHRDGYELNYEQIERQTGLGRYAINEGSKLLVELAWLEVNRPKVDGKFACKEWVLLNGEVNESIAGHSTMESSHVGQSTDNRITIPKEEQLQEEQLTNVQNDFEQVFEDFWEQYPRKQGKGEARRALFKQLKDFPAEIIVDGVRRLNADPNKPTNPKFLPMPATWLNGERWNDAPYPGDNKVLSVEDLKRMEEEAERGYF